jgi:hypothetical protein
MGDTFGDAFGIFFQVQMIWDKCFLKASGRLEMPMEKKSHLKKKVKGRLEVWNFVFFVFSNKYVQNILLAPN